jgi:hypothetical protein
MARLFQRLADHADSAVHHIARRDDIGPGCGLVERWPTSTSTVASFRT